MSSFWPNSTLQYWTALTGTIFLLYQLITGLRFAWDFVRPSRLHKFQHAGSNSWACVTGASDGIGLAFAQELLAAGFNVLLHGRNATKLGKIRSQLSQEFPEREVDLVVADASKYDDSYSTVVAKISSLPGKLTVLVNNVGGIHTYPQYVSHAEIEHDAIDICINVNLRFATHLIRDLLPVLRANGPSLLANVGSVGGLIGVPYLTTYR